MTYRDVTKDAERKISAFSDMLGVAITSTLLTVWFWVFAALLLLVLILWPIWNLIKFLWNSLRSVLS